MALAFDSLGYAQHLRAAGVPQEQAEAHAQAARTYIMLDLVTKSELRDALDTAVLRLTVRMGVMIGAGVAALAALQKLGA